MKKVKANLCSLLDVYKASNYHQNKDVDEKHEALYDYIESILFNRKHIFDLYNFLKDCAKNNQLVFLSYKYSTLNLFVIPLANTDFVYNSFKEKYERVLKLINDTAHANIEEFSCEDFYLSKREIEHFLRDIYVIT